MSGTFRAAVRHGGGWLPLIGLVVLTGSVISLALPTVLGRTIDAVIAGGNGQRWILLAAGLVALAVVCDLADIFATTACVAATTAWLRHRLIGRVLNAGPDRVRPLDTGDLVSRVSGNAVDAAQAGPSVVGAIAGAMPPIGSLVLLTLIDPWLALAFAAGVVTVVLVLVAFARRTSEVSLAYAETQGRIAALLTESLTGIRTISAAGTTDQERRRVLAPVPVLHGEGQQTWFALARAGAQAALIGPLVLVAVLAAAGWEVAHGQITVGQFFAAAQYAALGAGLGSLTGLLGELARAKAGATRADEVMGLEPLGYGSLGLHDGAGRLEFHGVAVHGEDGPLLRDVDLDLPAGATVAVVGPSGAGKSVLAALAGRLRDPDEGQVVLDGVPLRALHRDVLRTAVGIAFERPALVGATVADTIGLGSLPPVKVAAAARATHAHDFISRLPEGYNTPLPEAPMSGGEAQRLGLARAWPAQRLLVLDDATSSLDTATEQQISHTLLDSGGTRTKLIVTHRVVTAARADLVVWLDGGRVRDVGTHEDLCGDPAYKAVFG